MKTKAVYAGTFDPVTYGHLWIIDEAAKLFDQVVVAVGDNAGKRPWFSSYERRELLGDSLKVYDVANVEIAQFQKELLVDYARRIEATHIVRGIRNVQDFEFERGLCNTNRLLDPRLPSVFLIPPAALAEVSSSGLKSIVHFSHWKLAAMHFAPPPVLEALERRELERSVT